MKKFKVSKTCSSKPRERVLFNTGTRVEQPKKGRTSYTRKNKHKTDYFKEV